MTLIVEDGTGLALADSYCSTDYAADYHANLGNDAWDDLDQTQQEQYLRRATNFLGQAYRARWAGFRRSDTQALDWPRYQVPIKDSPGAYAYGSGFGGALYPFDAVPDGILRATAELALRAMTITLQPDLAPPVLMKKVGPIEIQYGAGARQTTVYAAVEGLLQPFLRGSDSYVPITRA